MHAGKFFDICEIKLNIWKTTAIYLGRLYQAVKTFTFVKEYVKIDF